MVGGFDTLWARFSWRPMPRCPGRFVLCGGPSELEPREIAGIEDDGQQVACSTDQARDPVIVIAFSNGGLISYAKGDGRFVHTLNDPQGFERKLAELGIDLACDNNSGGGGG